MTSHSNLGLKFNGLAYIVRSCTISPVLEFLPIDRHGQSEEAGGAGGFDRTVDAHLVGHPLSSGVCRRAGRAIRFMMQ
jgi:hypothetical protein